MPPRWCLSVAVALGLLGFLESAEAAVDPSVPKLSCDDLLTHAFPDLCELEVTRSTLSIRGLTLVYWRFRDARGPGGRTPLLVAHGGPGFNHQYMLPLRQQACRGRDVVFWDQGGCGESTQPANVSQHAPWLLTVSYYNEEVRALVENFGWERFHLLGNSWGTILGQSYALLQDPRLHAIVLSGPVSDLQLYQRSQWDPVEGNMGSLPDYVQDTIHQLEEKRAYGSPLYQADDDILTHFFTTRTIPAPDCFTRAVPSTPTTKQIYVGMQGASEFTIGGVLRDWNVTGRLHEIKNPVLLTYGRYDTMRPPVIDAMYRNLPRVWKAMMPRSGHCTAIDDPRLMNDVVGDFLERADAGGLEGFVTPCEAGDLEGFVIPSEAKDPRDGLQLPRASPHLAARTGSDRWLDAPSLLLGASLGAAFALLLGYATGLRARSTRTSLAVPLTA